MHIQSATLDGKITAYLAQTCQVSWNFGDFPEMTHDLQVSRQCYKNSQNVGNLVDLSFFCNKACFCWESERILVGIREMLITGT